jgi:hypothetical protein
VRNGGPRRHVDRFVVDGHDAFAAQHVVDLVLVLLHHPNVAAPGGSINFLWMMAANREREDRQYGVVNMQPEFAAVPSGLDKGR